MSAIELEPVRCASAGKLAGARERISACGSAVVAFSAGVDSTFVLAVAREVMTSPVITVSEETRVDEIDVIGGVNGGELLARDFAGSNSPAAARESVFR